MCMFVQDFLEIKLHSIALTLIFHFHEKGTNWMYIFYMDMEGLIEEYVDSELTCSKARKNYSELENILIRQDYLHNINFTVNPHDKLKSQDTTTISLIKKKSITKTKSNNLDNSTNTLNKHPISSHKYHFIAAQKKIHEFESYKHSMQHTPNKYATQFIMLLEEQNVTMSKRSLENNGINNASI